MLVCFPFRGFIKLRDGPASNGGQKAIASHFQNSAKVQIDILLFEIFLIL